MSLPWSPPFSLLIITHSPQRSSVQYINPGFPSTHGQMVAATSVVACCSRPLSSADSEFNPTVLISLRSPRLPVAAVWILPPSPCHALTPLALPDLLCSTRSPCYSITLPHCPLKFNSIHFIFYSPKSQITNSPQKDLQSVQIWHPCPRTSHRIRKKSFTGKKGKKPSGEQQRRIPLQDGQKQ